MTPTPEIHTAERLAAANRLLDTVCDPEIPVLTIADLGLLRAVRWNETEQMLEVDITPTYSGCPAMKMIQDDIFAKLKENGVEKIKVNMIYSPAWTTDWITEEAKEKLRKYGIAPPERTTKRKCPHCNSENTEMVSQFGSTACKALYKCLDCKEPFDYFKCH